MHDNETIGDGGGIYPFLDQYGIWIYSIIGAICVGLSGVFPLLIIPIESGPALKHGAPAKKLRLMLSFAVGSLLGDVFLHLLPEVWAHLDRDQHGSFTGPSLWVIGGLLGFMCIEKLLGATEDEDESSSSEEQWEQSNNNQAASIKSSKSSSSPSSPSSSKSKSSHSSSKSIASSTSSSKTVLSSSSSSSLSCNPSSTKKGKKSSHNLAKNGKSSQTNTSNNQNEDMKGLHNGHSEHRTRKRSFHAPASQPIKISGYLNLFANVVDNFTHGLAVGTSFTVSVKVGVVTTIAILLHEIPHEVGDFAILLQSGFDKWKAARAQVWTASGGVIGAITALAVSTADISGSLSSWMLPFTSGGFLYIALVTVVPDLLKEKDPLESLKQVLCICLGVSSILFVTYALE